MIHNGHREFKDGGQDSARKVIPRLLRDSEFRLVFHNINNRVIRWE